MKCIACGAKTYLGTTTDVADIGNCLIVVRNVPCHKCSECNEVIYTADIVKHLETITTKAKAVVTEIAVVDYNNKVA